MEAVQAQVNGTASSTSAMSTTIQPTGIQHGAEVAQGEKHEKSPEKNRQNKKTCNHFSRDG